MFIPTEINRKILFMKFQSYVPILCFASYLRIILKLFIQKKLESTENFTATPPSRHNKLQIVI